jgi:hypothetical protein
MVWQVYNRIICQGLMVYNGELFFHVFSSFELGLCECRMRANSCLRMFGDACAFHDWFLPGFKAKTTLTEPSQDWWSQGVILSLLHMKVLGLSTCACTPEIRPFSGMIPLISHDSRLRSQ